MNWWERHAGTSLLSIQNNYFWKIINQVEYFATNIDKQREKESSKNKIRIFFRWLGKQRIKQMQLPKDSANSKYSNGHSLYLETWLHFTGM